MSIKGVVNCREYQLCVYLIGVVYYRGCLLKEMSFIVDLYCRGCLFRGCILQWVSIIGVSSIGCLLKGFSVTWVTDIGVSVKGVFL